MKTLPLFWVRNSRGKPDALLTFAAAGVTVVLAKVLLHGVKIGGTTPVELGGIDAGAIAAVLTPLLGAYTARRLGVKEDKAP